MNRLHDGATRRRWATLVSTASLALVVTACGDARELAKARDGARLPGGSTTSKQTTVVPPAPPPRTGACRRLRADDIPPSTNETPTVPCRSRHTALTFFVGRFKPAMLSGSIVSSAAKALADQRCTHRFYAYVGGGKAAKALSLLDVSYYVPSGRQLTRHANWFRCDIISGYDLQRRLYPLPMHVRGILSGGVPDAVRECVTQRFSTPRFAYVPCTRPHLQRAIAVLALGGPHTRFPNVPVQKSRISSWCGRETAAYLGYPSARYFWGYQWLTRQEWNDGNRFGKCFAVTTR
jgi:Septum formation